MDPMATVRTVILGVILLVGIMGCNSNDQGEDQAQLDMAPQPGGSMTIAIDEDPQLLNPIIATTSTSGSLNAVLNVSLITMNTEFEWEPGLATHWTWSADQTEVTFHLRNDAKWSDGQPVTTRDAMATFDLFRDPAVASSRASDFDNVASIEAVDEFTLRVKFGSASFENLFNLSKSFLPAHVVGSLDPAEIRSWSYNRNPLSYGPYALDRWSANNEVVLTRNPHYFGSPAYLDQLVFKVVPDESTRLLQLELGEVDMVGQIPHQEISRLEESLPDVKLYTIAARRVGYLEYNVREAPLDDVRVRQAISYAIDRRAIVDGLMFGYGELLHTPVPSFLGRFHNGNVTKYERNEHRSRDLLAQAGWTDTDDDGVVDKDGQKLSVVIHTRTGDPVRENGVLIIQRNLADVGIEAAPRMMELGAVLAAVRKGDYQMYLGQFNARLSPDVSANFATGGSLNRGGYSNPKLDEVLNAARLAIDETQAVRNWHESQAIIADDQPWSILWAKNSVVGIRKDIKNATPHALSFYENIAQWWRAPAEIQVSH